MLSSEQITFLVGIVGTLYGFLVFVWKKILKPTIELFKDHKHIKSSIEKIAREVVTNGGSSLRDAVNRIEASQKKIEQRSLASLNYMDAPLFELDTNGNLVWTNEKFYEITGETLSDLEGFDWIAYIREQDRPRFIEELHSCVHMSRKFECEVYSMDGKKIRFTGFPYKDHDTQHGFLFTLKILEA